MAVAYAIEATNPSQLTGEMGAIEEETSHLTELFPADMDMDEKKYKVYYRAKSKGNNQ